MKVSGPLLGVALLVLFVYLIALVALPASDILPHEFGYGHKLLNERLEYSLLIRDTARGLHLLKRADSRIDEIEQEYELENAQYYPMLVERYEHQLLSASNHTSIAREVVRNCTIYEPRLNALIKDAWDPPIRELFDRARLNTLKAHRRAITVIADDDPKSAAYYSLSAARKRLDEARLSPTANLARRPLLDYTAWLLFTKGLSQELYNKSNSSLEFDRATLDILDVQLAILKDMNGSLMYTDRKQVTHTMNITSHVRHEAEEHLISKGVMNQTIEPVQEEEEEIIEPEVPIEPEEDNVERVSATLRANELEPETVEVNLTKEVELSIRAQGDDYSISIPSVGVRTTLIEQGNTLSVRFNTTQAGTYLVKCANYCLYTGSYGHIKVVSEEEP